MRCDEHGGSALRGDVPVAGGRCHKNQEAGKEVGLKSGYADLNFKGVSHVGYRGRESSGELPGRSVVHYVEKAHAEGTQALGCEAQTCHKNA